MTIHLHLVLSVIVEAVKAETHIKALTDKAADEKATALAFHEDAGDENFHQRKIMRTLYHAVEQLKSNIADYVVPTTVQSADNIVSDIDSATDAITLTLSVNDRFNQSLTDSLARLCSKYIEDQMLFLWWGTINQNQAKFYQQLIVLDLQNIQRCFTKTAPTLPTTPYTRHITTEIGNSYVMNFGDTDTLTYIIDDDALDDVQGVTDSPGIVSISPAKEPRSFTLTARNTGVAYVTLYSRHDEDVSYTVTVTVVRPKEL